MSTHNVCFYRELMKIILQLSSNTLLIWSFGCLQRTHDNIQNLCFCLTYSLDFSINFFCMSHLLCLYNVEKLAAICAFSTPWTFLLTFFQAYHHDQNSKNLLPVICLKLSQLMRFWHFLSSVNSFFNRACAAIQWG